MYSLTHVLSASLSVYPSTQAVSHLPAPSVVQLLSVVQCVSHTEWMRQGFDISQIVRHTKQKRIYQPAVSHLKLYVRSGI